MGTPPPPRMETQWADVRDHFSFLIDIKLNGAGAFGCSRKCYLPLMTSVVHVTAVTPQPIFIFLGGGVGADISEE